MYELTILLPYHQGFVSSFFHRNFQICSQNIFFPSLTSRQTVFNENHHAQEMTSWKLVPSALPLTVRNCGLAFFIKEGKVNRLSEEEQESLKFERVFFLREGNELDG